MRNAYRAKVMGGSAALLLVVAHAVSAQNAAVSAYLNPNDNFSGDIRVKEVRVPASGLTPYTYWCTLGWFSDSTSGYGGMQYTADGFQYRYSIWNDSAVPAWHDPKMSYTAFGGEGTGVTSWTYAYPWSTDVWNVLADRAWDVGRHTMMAFFVKNGKTGVWRHLITWDVPLVHQRYGYYSYNFLEDWIGTGEHYREYHSRRGWKRNSSTLAWFPITQENFSIVASDTVEGGRCRNYRSNWQGGTRTDADGESYWFMGTGSSIAPSNNTGVAWTIARAATSPQEEYGVAKVSGLSATLDPQRRRLFVVWTTDSLSVPQFASNVTVLDSAGKAVLQVSDTSPQRRSDTLDVSSLAPDLQAYTVRLSVTDILDGKAAVREAVFGGKTEPVAIRARARNPWLSPLEEPTELTLYGLDGRKLWSKTVSPGDPSLSRMLEETPGGCGILLFKNPSGSLHRIVHLQGTL